MSIAGCAPQSTPPVVKIGLIAPFEGPSRPLGYSVLYAVRLRLNEWNESGGLPRVELVALNDDGNPDLAAKLPAQLAADPDVVLVLGPPQGHTALAALPALAEHQLPTISLAPLPDASPHPILPFAGSDSDLLAALAEVAPGAAPARTLPLAAPSFWLGDPLTLAKLVQKSPELVPTAGAVAAEQAFAGWAGSAANGLIWAAAFPADLPDHFPGAYQQLAGSPPTPSAALAYKAVDEALKRLPKTPTRTSMAEALGDIQPPPITLFIRQEGLCCQFLNPIR